MIFLELVKIGQKVYEVEVANNFFTRGKGLMFRKEFENNKSLFITPCNSIHTCFMKFPISVIFVDKKGIVVKTKYNVKPWKMVFAFGAHSVYEINTEGNSEDILPKVGDKVTNVKTLFGKLYFFDIIEEDWQESQHKKL